MQTNRCLRKLMTKYRCISDNNRIQYKFGDDAVFVTTTRHPIGSNQRVVVYGKNACRGVCERVHARLYSST